ncbi:hypothetical protein [Microbacterium sp. CFBP9034]|uniref:hypothetical protein n=1 Tax=Microbacterium sp. CFBP9034 TaxID=3096540 RepID=UPI002A6A0B25|nr:hypothetical protein [Microbacterium sp. CFBP9034]MDY0908370.1 hypothetical protein [Microbacterium sp. CFBP9034]
MTATSPIHTTRRAISTMGALLLTVAGNMLVVAIAVTALALVGVAAAVVFGAGVLESF